MKVTINKENLPAVAANGVYTLRFRIVSKDKNNASYWTPIVNVLLPREGSKFVKTATSANVYHQRIGQGTPQNYNVYLTWHDPNNLGFYDVYTRWHKTGGEWTEWELLSRQSSKTLAFTPPLHLSPAGFDRYGVAVTRSTFDKQYNPLLALFETPPDGLRLV